ncbi:MAG: hypothetical protein ABIZ81_18785 [Opitutaceae bacterium]
MFATCWKLALTVVEKTAGLFEFKQGLATIAKEGTYFGPAVAALLRNVVANFCEPGSVRWADRS